jgi:hypothetical protein
MKPSSCSQNSSIGHYPESVHSSPYIHASVLKYIYIYVLSLIRLSFKRGRFFGRFSNKISVSVSRFPHAYCMSCPSHLPWFVHPNNIDEERKLRSFSCCYFIHPTPASSFQMFVSAFWFLTPSSVLFSYNEWQSFKPMYSRWSYSFCILIFMFLDRALEDKNSELNSRKHSQNLIRYFVLNIFFTFDFTFQNEL